MSNYLLSEQAKQHCEQFISTCATDSLRNAFVAGYEFCVNEMAQEFDLHKFDNDSETISNEQ